MAQAMTDQRDLAHRFSASSLAVIGVCSAVFFLDGLIHTVLGPMAPEISQELGLSPTTLGPIFSANLIGQTFGLLAFPLLANRYGHRIVVILAVIGFCLAQYATALAWNGNSLFAFRLIDGVFLGGCMPSCLAIVTRVSPPGRQGLSVMMLFTGYGSGATASGILASAFLDAGGWRIAIGIVGTVSAATAVAAWMWLRGVDEEAGVESDGRSMRRSSALEVVSPPLLGGTLLLWLMFISMLTVQYCLSSWLPTLMVEVGRDQSFAALSVTIFSLGGIIAALGVGVLIDRFGGTQVLVTFLALATVLLFMIGRSLATASSTALMVMLVTGGFFFLGAYGGVNFVLATYYPDHLRAIGIGLTKSVGRVGTIIAPILIGLAIAAHVRETTVMSLFAIPAGLSAAAVLLVGILAHKESGSGAVATGGKP
ncbi:MFS transporter [Croceibacterium aestuarii]|uniref:MFS transporter n=1 Tax=Croceibacterium aestuarii TaxID=3064139 RepID=UPI00272ED8E7|nr:MFS transporter [Croceibacterium sp. D39]